MERNSIYVILAVTVALTQASCQNDEMVNRRDMDGMTVRYAVASDCPVQGRAEMGNAGTMFSLTGNSDSLSIPMEWTVTDGIGISPTPDGTKGTLVNTTGDDNMALSEFASLIGNTFVAKAFDGEGAEKVLQTVTWSTTSSAWVGAPEAKWPKGTNLDFLAYANLPGSQTATITKDGVSTVHTVPASAADQKDILFGHYSGNGDNTGTAEIRFEHPLTAVRFLQGELGDGFVIKGISLEGIAETGTASMAPGGTITWSGVESHEYTVSQDKADGLVLSDLAGYDGAKLIGEPFIIIPQDLASNNVTVTVTFTNGKTASAELATGAWKAGKTNTYTIGYNPTLLSGKFSVSATEYVQFSRGNLYCTDNGTSASPRYTFGFEQHQYDFRLRYSAGNSSKKDGNSYTVPENESGMFQWNKGNAVSGEGYGAFTTAGDPVGNNDDHIEWGITISDKWHTLDTKQWNYLIGRKSSTGKSLISWAVVGGIQGLVLAPDNYSGFDSDYFTCTLSEWQSYESNGFVFLPGCGELSNGKTISMYGGSYYSTSDPDLGGLNNHNANFLCAYYSEESHEFSYSVGSASRSSAHPVRLVQMFDKPEVEPDFIDLGLPSGTLWADVNVGATSKTGDGSYGKLYAWGETETKTKASFTIDNYRFASSFTKYNATDLLTVLQSADDVAASKVSGSHIPTREQYEELINSAYTTYSWEDDYNGVPGLLITSKTYSTRSIFLPAAGLQNEAVPVLVGTNGCYWSSTLNPTPKDGEGTSFPACAIDLDFEKDKTPFVYTDNDNSQRYMGQSVRAVKQGWKTIEYVEIGGLKWATCNLGANTPKDYGWYFSWAGTTGYVRDGSKWVTAQGGSELSGGFSWANAPYNTGGVKTSWNKYIPTGQIGYWPGGGSPDNKLSLELDDDAVRANLGGSWRMPTQADFQTLYEACGGTGTSVSNPPALPSANPGKGIYWVKADQNYISDYTGVAGILFCDGISKLFFVAAGYGVDNNFNDDGYSGRYWSGTVYLNPPCNAYYMAFIKEKVQPDNSNSRNQGFPVRPVSDL